MAFQQYLGIVLRFWRGTLAVVVVCVAGAAVFSNLQSPVYSASASVFLTVKSEGGPGELSPGAFYTQSQLASYLDVATSTPVLESIIEELGMDATPEALATQLSVWSPEETSIIHISARSETASGAAVLANAATESVLTAVNELSPTGADGQRLAGANMIDSAVAPSSPSEPNLRVNVALGAALGILLGVGQIAVRSDLDTRVRDKKDIELLTGAPILGEVKWNHVEARQNAERQVSSGVNAEAFRRLRTNLSFVGSKNDGRAIVFTSAGPGEGKTEIVSALALVLAQAGESVLLIDADLRHSNVASRMGIDAGRGLADLLADAAVPQDVLHIDSSGFLSVLLAGTMPPNPSELLGSKSMSSFLSIAERQYDYVLIDSPPLLPVTDAVVLSAHTRSAVLVSQIGNVRGSQLREAVTILEASRADLLGVVINEVEPSGEKVNWHAATSISFAVRD
ncbi:polysaccharide biosynthesis tyrosine autokinase [Citricoccus alkalitolerans]|uniref:non-specific protein-tyrosine kinase n=1 Tax=Citricoccus alkalitolerans TaxID=246603 RepID=A0ABV8XXZ6_9MICC